MNIYQQAFGHLRRFSLFPRKTSWVILTFICLLIQIKSMNYVELQPTESDVRKSQIISFRKGEIDNYYNYQYYARMELGNPPQKFDVILDTGSHLLWVPSLTCQNCPSDYRKFDAQASNTTVPLPLREHILYGRGQVEGYYVMENVLFQGLTSRMNLLLVDKQNDTQHSQADGIMGLSNLRSIKNVFDIGYKNNYLISSNFAFELGRKELKQKSYFIYNISQKDYTQAVYINATDRDYWNIPAREIAFGNLLFKNKKALVDSGTSLILLPQNMLQQMNQHIFSQYCTKVLWSSSRRCKCPHEVSYPNITILSSSLQFNITPQSYISGAYNRRNCMLGIQTLPTEDLDMIILGDIFFHDKTIIFDKTKNKIGFISNAKTIYVYPQQQWIFYVFDAIALLGIGSAIAILMMRKKRINEKSDLSEGLRARGAGEMQLSGIE